MTCKLYQIHLTEQDAAVINRLGWTEAAKKLAHVGPYLDVRTGTKPFQKEWGRFYQHVCDVDTDDLDEVFHITNVGPQEKITMKASSMHSGSVGDIIETPDGEFHLIAGIGFTKLDLDKRYIGPEVHNSFVKQTL